MSAATQSAHVLLSRVLSLKEPSPLILVRDTVAQSSYSLVKEVFHNSPANVNVIFVSFETVKRPVSLFRVLKDKEGDAELHFVEAYEMGLKSVVEAIDKVHDSGVNRRNLVVVDSLNYIDGELLSRFLTSIIKPNTTVLGTFHTSLPDVNPDVGSHYYYPHTQRILQFIASSILEIIPNVDEENEELQAQLNSLRIPRGLNSTDSIKINFINRRKSGRSMSYKFQMDLQNHQYTQIINDATTTNDDSTSNDMSMFDNLTTFNLNTSARQKIARDSVALPYLDAQNFENGGAIVYEFEKDDDYDEEDPYEDPF